nr:hypothetical protein [Bryobacterales bacterium]
AIIGLPISMVNNDVLASTYRLENVGKQVYLHYYGGSSYILNVAAKIGNPSPEEELARRKRVLENILPVAHKRIPQDPMLLHLLENAGMMSVEVKDYPSVVYYMNLAIEKGGGSAQGYYYLAYAYYVQKDFANSLTIAPPLR